MSISRPSCRRQPSLFTELRTGVPLTQLFLGVEPGPQLVRAAVPRPAQVQGHLGERLDPDVLRPVHRSGSPRPALQPTDSSSVVILRSIRPPSPALRRDDAATPRIHRKVLSRDARHWTLALTQEDRWSPARVRNRHGWLSSSARKSSIVAHVKPMSRHQSRAGTAKSTTPGASPGAPPSTVTNSGWPERGHAADASPLRRDMPPFYLATPCSASLVTCTCMTICMKLRDPSPVGKRVMCSYMHPFGLARRLKHRRPATAPRGLRHESRSARIGRDRRVLRGAPRQGAPRRRPHRGGACSRRMKGGQHETCE